MSGNSQDNPQLQQQNLQLRIALNDAYAALEGDKTTQSFSAITFDECAQLQIQLISGPDTPTRPNQLNQVKNTLNSLQQAVKQIMALPPEAFQTPDRERDVNPPVGTTA